MSVIDELLSNNRKYAESFGHSELPASPARKVAVLSCMDARLDLHRILGLGPGDVHVIRNAGGSVTEDALRSLLISNLLGAEEALVIHHTDCRMRTLSEQELREQAVAKFGAAPPFPMGALPELEESLRQAVGAIRESAFLAFDTVVGAVYEVETGLLRPASV